MILARPFLSLMYALRFTSPHLSILKLIVLQVNETVLKKVIEWCDHHKNDPPTAGDDDDNRRKTTDIDEWDQKFMQVDQEMLFEVILVSHDS